MAGALFRIRPVSSRRTPTPPGMADFPASPEKAKQAVDLTPLTGCGNLLMNIKEPARPAGKKRIT